MSDVNQPIETSPAKTNALELSRDFAEGIIETFRDPLLILDDRLNVITANTAFYNKFSTTPEHTEWHKIYHLDNESWDIPELRALLKKILADNTSFRDFELNHTFKGLGRRILLLNGRRIVERGEDTDKILLVIEDITDRRREERNVRFQADALNRVNDAVIAVDKEEGITYWNSRAEKLLNIPKDASEGVKIDTLCARIDRETPGELFATSPEDKPWREYRVLMKESDEEYYLESSATNNYEKDGTLAGRLIVLRDVTAKKKAEIALRQLNRDLELFTAIASHDLQQPLRTVSMYVGMLAESFLGKHGEKTDSYINFALEGTKRMHTLINDLLEYSRIEAGGEKYRRLSLEKVISDVLKDVKAEIEESRATIEAQDLPEVIADETQMRQVFQNLICNAMNYKDERRLPHILISASKSPTEWVLTVRDNGVGFDETHTERVFKIFERLDPVASPSGSGLGLTIAKKIVEGHGGRIWAESIPGTGSTFTFTLPR